MYREKTKYYNELVPCHANLDHLFCETDVSDINNNNRH